MRRVAITTMMHSKSGFVWWACEVDVDPDLTDDEMILELSSRLVEDKLLEVLKLEFEFRDGARHLVNRTPAILGIGMVGTISPLHFDVVEG